MNISLVQYIAQHARVHPDKPCIIDQHGTLAYGNFWKEIVRFSNQLINISVGNGDLVVVLDNKLASFFIATFAIHLVGAVFVPAEKNIAHAYLLELLDETNAKLVITDENIRDIIPSEIACLKFPGKIDESAPLSDYEIKNLSFPKPEKISDIIFTTGTTGKSKGVILSFKSISATIENIIHSIDIKPNNIELIPLPLNHSFGLRRCYANFFNGSTIILFEKIIFIKKFFETLEKYNVTSVSFTPAEASMMLELSGNTLSRFDGQIDYVQLSGSIIPEILKQKLSKQLPNARLYSAYGCTEAGASCYFDFNAEPEKPFCIGKPTMHTKLFFVDEYGQAIETNKDNPGYLICGGPMVMDGYFNAPELTNQTLRDGFIYSTDLAYMGNDDNIYIVGRMDDVINIGGIKVAPADIENRAIFMEGIADAACIAIEDKMAGQIPKLYVALRPNYQITQQQVRNFLEQFLDNIKIPKYIEFIEEIPRNNIGKIDYKILKQLNNSKC